MPILEVQHLYKNFGSTKVLKDISFYIGARQGACHHRLVRLGQDHAAALPEFSRNPE